MEQRNRGAAMLLALERRRDSRACGNTKSSRDRPHGGAREKMRRYVGRVAEATTLTGVVHREPSMTNEDMERTIDLVLELYARQQGVAVRRCDCSQRRHRCSAAIS